MCENLEVSLSQSLEAFRGTQVQEVTALQAEADQMTDAAEQSFAKYLNGRQYASEDNVGSWNKLSEQVSNGFSKTWRDSADLTRFRRGNSNVGNSNSNKDHNKKDPTLIMATTAANLRLTLEHIRLAQTSAELKRFQLLQKLVSIKVRHWVALILLLSLKCFGVGCCQCRSASLVGCLWSHVCV
jgi:phage-related minor tail protein